MIKFGILSDTHISEDDDSKKNMSFLKQLKKIFKDVDQIIHAGDICDNFLINELKKIAPTICVKGNKDYTVDESEFKKIRAGKYKIGIIHKLPGDLKSFFEEKDIDILIHGHTHYPIIKGTEYDKLLLNPGSPTLPKPAPKKRGFEEPQARRSVLILQIDEETNMVSTFIVNLKPF